MTIRKELALLIKEKQANCKTEKEKNKALNEARQQINAKYGKDWRESSKDYNYNRPSWAQELGDEWDDYAWSGNDF
jgi:hypothetical protein